VVEIDPGMSFGTGQHATTLFCLGVLDSEAKPGRRLSVLDAGCGSGILAIAASKLGYGPIGAFDYDPDAVAVAKENIRKNGISNVSPTVDDAALYRGCADGYDLVCANILGHLLKAYRHNIASWVKPGGLLALSGILTTEFDGVAGAFSELGFAEIRRGTLREWTGGLFRRTGKK